MKGSLRRGGSRQRQRSQKVRQPLDALGVADLAHDRAHEDFDRADVLRHGRHLLARRHEPELHLELLLRHGLFHVDLVAENEERRVRERFSRQKDLHV